ncbi:MAG: hypothetical protein KIT15_11900 [Xanthobacteraceae bacterium]|nr:hypothetical protein [Xanthobacteraceae bacterium]MBX3549161.1 hypothetical protein [Xanthobacteraceae bacterium]MCW5675271.1 hypothetical protein [Xanthobacteraceae bacterium]
MSRDKVRIIPFPKRKTVRQRDWSRVPMDLLFIAGLGVAFVIAHYSDKPPLVDKPISLQRTGGPQFADNPQIGVRVIDSGLRGYER